MPRSAARPIPNDAAQQECGLLGTTATAATLPKAPTRFGNFTDSDGYDPNEDPTMALTALTDDWLTDGRVGLDVEIDTTVGVSGNSSLHFIDGGAACSVFSKWVSMEGFDILSKAVPSQMVTYAIAKADSATSGENFQLDIEYTTDFATIGTITVYSGVVSTLGWDAFGWINNWFAAGKWFRIVLSRPNSRAFDLWIDRIYSNGAPAHFIGKVNGNSDAFGSSWSLIAHADTREASSQCTVASNIFIARVPGTWTVIGSVLINDADLADGDMFGIRLKATSTFLGTVYGYGATVALPAAYDASTEPLPMSAQLVIDLDVNDTVELEVIQFTNTGDLKTYNSAMYHAVRVTAEQ